MFHKGELIVYGSSGVCRIEAIGPLKGMGSAKSDRDYYTLSPLFGSGVIYTPVDTNVFIRPVLSREQVDQLIDRIPTLEETQCSSNNLRAITEHYHAAFESHRCEDLLRLLKQLHHRGQASIKQGRRIGLTEMKYRKQAEELVHGEFAAALGIAKDDVPAYISARLSGQDPN